MTRSDSAFIPLQVNVSRLNLVLHAPVLMCFTCCHARVGKDMWGKLQQLKIHLSEHKSAIRQKDETSPAAKHFIERSHNVPAFRWIGIEKVIVNRRGGDLHTK